MRTVSAKIIGRWFEIFTFKIVVCNFALLPLINIAYKFLWDSEGSNRWSSCKIKGDSRCRPGPTRLKTRRRANSMISPRRVNQEERNHQPFRYLTSIKPRTAHHVGIQGRGVAPLITEQIVGPRSSSRQKNRWRWSDRRVAPDRFW